MVGANLCVERARRFPGIHFGLIGQNAKAVRNVMVQGLAGILAACPPDFYPEWTPTTGLLVFPNGSVGEIGYSEAPYGIRGLNLSFAWADEISTWDDAHRGIEADTAWTNLDLAVRVKRDGFSGPRIVATSTPRPVQLFKDLKNKPGVHITHASLFDNPHLDEESRQSYIASYAGGRLERQELHGELLEDNPNAEWQREWIDDHRYREDYESLKDSVGLTRIVVAVDPAVTSGEKACDHGIVVCGLGSNGHGYVLSDGTVRGQSHVWAQRAVDLYNQFQADCIVVERNQGGDFIPNSIRSINPNIPVIPVVATRGKVVRAAPVAMLYQQGRVHHVGIFPELEDQQCLWDQELAKKAKWDRVDALVWGMTYLFPTIAFGGTGKVYTRFKR